MERTLYRRDMSWKKVLLGLLVFIAGVEVVALTRNFTSRPTVQIPFLVLPTPTPSPTPTPMPVVQNVHSPDGTMQLIEKQVGATYSFSVDTVPATVAKPLYAKTVSGKETMAIHLNSWSPDNRLVFLSDTTDATHSAFAFRATAEPFADGVVYRDVAHEFETRNPELKVRDVTGWDAPTLLHVTTNGATGRGPSFWYDVEGNYFLQLAGL